MNDNNFIFKMGNVEEVNDTQGGSRIKVRLPEDSNINTTDLPWAFPLMPKLYHSIPQIGECVLVFVSRVDKFWEDRYWLGPVISQLNKTDYDPFYYSSRSFFANGYVLPDANPTNKSTSKGIYPDLTDVAILGRGNTDILQKDNCLNIRCGVSLDDAKTQFNTNDLGFIQFKYGGRTDKNSENQYNSSINVVADRINLISYDSKTKFNTTDPNELINDESMKEILDKAHQLPYGDLLVDFIKLFLKSYAIHVHPYPGMPPIQDKPLKDVLAYDLSSVLSQSIRIN